MLYCTEYVKSHAARNDTVEQSIYDFPVIDTKFIQYMTLSSADDIPAAIAAGFCKKKLARAAIKANWGSLVSSEVESMSDALYGRRTITERNFDGGCSQHTRIEVWEVPHLGKTTLRFDY